MNVADALAGEKLAVVVRRDGRVPAGSDETVAEAGGRVLLVGTGDGTGDGIGDGIGDGTGPAGGGLLDGLPSASEAWIAEGVTAPGQLAALLAPVLGGVAMVLMPASPDGRDLAPRLAAAMGRPLLAGAVRVAGGAGAMAEVLRVDGRVVVPVAVDGPVVATLMPGVRSGAPAGTPPAAVVPIVIELEPPTGQAAHDARLIELVEPDPATMDLADAKRVLAGGAGLVPQGGGNEQALAMFELLVAVAAALGASAGATRVVTDAGWMGFDRQIGTTGVTIDPDVYVALGVSGATQHVGGIGSPGHIASVNTDPSCPMTAMADLGLVADASGVLIELASRLGVGVPPALITELKEGDA